MATSAINPDWPRRSRVWLVLDRAASAPRTVLDTTQRAIEGGVDVVVCRLKELPEAEQLPIAGQVRELCAVSSTPFVMSHFPNLAKTLAADAIQLGQRDPSLADVRQQLGSEVLIGYSTHSVDEANKRLAEGADYVFLGPVYPTSGKLKYGDPLGIAAAEQALKLVKGVLVCIGGINQSNLAELAALGIQRVAAIAALQEDCDPADAVHAFKSILNRVGDSQEY